MIIIGIPDACSNVSWIPFINELEYSDMIIIGIPDACSNVSWIPFNESESSK